MTGISYITRLVSPIIMSCINIEKQPVSLHGHECCRFMARFNIHNIPGIFNIDYPNLYVHSRRTIDIGDGRPAGRDASITGY